VYWRDSQSDEVSVRLDSVCYDGCVCVNSGLELVGNSGRRTVEHNEKLISV
jgi:hypothetical protein